MNIETATLPVHWACYFINDDCSGMDDDDVAAADAWLDANYPQGAFCIDVSEDVSFMRWHDAAPAVLACECAVFTFDVNP